MYINIIIQCELENECLAVINFYSQRSPYPIIVLCPIDFIPDEQLKNINDFIESKGRYYYKTFIQLNDITRICNKVIDK